VFPELIIAALIFIDLFLIWKSKLATSPAWAVTQEQGRRAADAQRLVLRLGQLADLPIPPGAQFAEVVPLVVFSFQTFAHAPQTGGHAP